MAGQKSGARRRPAGGVWAVLAVCLPILAQSLPAAAKYKDNAAAAAKYKHKHSAAAAKSKKAAAKKAGRAPVKPQAKPARAGAARPPAKLDRNAVSAIPPAADFTGLAGVTRRLQTGLYAAYHNRGAEAWALKNSYAKGSLERQVLAWAIAGAAPSGVSAAQLWQNKAELAGWPGQKLLQSGFERALAREDTAPALALRYFADSAPQTAAGMAVLAQAYRQAGQSGRARALILPWWRQARLSAAEEQQMQVSMGGLLTAADYRARLSAQLYAGQKQAAARLAARAGGEGLYQAYLAAAASAADTERRLAALPAVWKKEPVAAFIRLQYLRRAGFYEKAADIMLATPAAAGAEGNSQAWWAERRALSRELLDIGRPDLAYRLAAGYRGFDKLSAADAEFHAGWYALRFLNRPQQAAQHFARIAALSSGAVSRARGYYWQGRAAEALRQRAAAAEFYAAAARYPAAFYGLLAAQALGKAITPPPLPRPDLAERRHFAGSRPAQALALLEKAGYGAEARGLYAALAAELRSSGELALLAAQAEKHKNYYSSLKIGKSGALRALNIGALAHPLGAIPAASGISARRLALAYAVARQESEFNPQALSPANARGLLQLLPITAKSVAERQNIRYSLDKLSLDAGYNARLGVHYLEEQMQKFGGSYILTFAAYNAGAGRAADWVRRYGDPRGQNTEFAVDWIERIPFTETRNYVQRVTENYEVYKARLGGRADISADIRAGRRE